MGSSIRFANSVLLAVGLSLAASAFVAAQSKPLPSGAGLVVSANASPDLAQRSISPPANQLQQLVDVVELQNSSYDPPVEGGPQSSQGSGTR